jgi:hypothetical protein
MIHARTELLDWLHLLDSYTNDAYGRARTLSAIRQECVACGHPTTASPVNGLCKRCVAERVADSTAASRL